MPVDTPDFPLTGEDEAMVLDPGQDLVVVNSAGAEVMRLSADDGTIRLRRDDLTTTVRLQAESGNLRMGGAGADGDLLLYPSSATNQDAEYAVIHLNADGRSIRVGQSSRPGQVRVRGDNEGLDLNGADGSLVASGRVDVRTSSGGLRAQLTAGGNARIGGAGARGRLEVRDQGSDATIILNGESGHGQMGGFGTDARLELRQADGTSTIVLNGETANLGLGAVSGGNAGALFLKDDSGEDSIVINGASGEASLGRSGNAGRMTLRDDNGQRSIVMNGEAGNVSLGRAGVSGDLFLSNDTGQRSIHLSGGTGNLNLRGDVRFTNSFADCAEEFDHALPVAPERGSVLIIGEDGRLAQTETTYDKRVAGVVSGAGHLNPGIILGENVDAPKETRCLLAVIGRVLVRADAGQGAIKVGDLLTTSATPGHAMRVTNHTKAQGAVIGKALGRLDAGCGFVEMLISLQ